MYHKINGQRVNFQYIDIGELMFLQYSGLASHHGIVLAIQTTLAIGDQLLHCTQTAGLVVFCTDQARGLR